MIKDFYKIEITKFNNLKYRNLKNTIDINNSNNKEVSQR